ncbi:MAG: hypothetical protein MZU84_03225 [Sphingobacterium sp.]|nr:hypothetical protein [Sphingobacterium sp.]
MPPLEAVEAEYLELLFEAGPVRHGGFGPMALSWTDLSDWLRLTGRTLSPPESRLIRRLSGLYAAALPEMRAAEVPAPWPEKSVEERSETVTEQIGLALSAMARKPRTRA